MKLHLKILSVLLSLILLTSCTFNVSKGDVVPPSVTIETFRTNPTTQSELTTTAPPVTTSPDTITEATTSTVESTTETTESEVTTTTEETTVTTPPTTTEEVTTTTEAELDITPYSGIMYATDSLNVREEPDADSDRVGRYSKGDEVTVTGLVSNGWVRVDYKGNVCYVSGKYLTETNPNSATSKTEEEEEVIEDEKPVSTNKYNSLNYIEQKAIWFAYLDIDAMLAGATEADFRTKIASAFANVAATGFNTVYVHVRAFGDAYYYSDYYAFTDSYSGKTGVRPDFDPLDVMIEEAHSRGLSFHAWINPMRTTDDEHFKDMSSDYTLKKWYKSSSANGTYLVYNSKTEFYWLSPAYPAVRELICNGISELVNNYDVDAIHIDDYFYPTTSAKFDEDAYKASGTSMTLSDWRRSVVSNLVKEMYQTVKNCNSSVLFGISPAGNTKNNYENYYADIYLWGKEKGYCDYMVPQIYYGFDDSLPFDDTVEEWNGIVTNSSVKLICGLAAYKVGSNTEWSSGNMLRRQVEIVNGTSRYSGYALYRYLMIFQPEADVQPLMSTELMNLFR